MKKIIFFFVFLLFFFSLPIGTSFTFEKEAINDVIAKELKQPATFLLKIKNPLSIPQYIRFYTFIPGISFAPAGNIEIPAASEKEITLGIYLSERIRKERKGNFVFTYYIANSKREEDRAAVKILPLSEILDIRLPEAITQDTKNIEIEIINKENIVLEEIEIQALSDFFEAKEQFSLKQFEKKNFTLEINEEKLKELTAGSYLAKFVFFVNEAKIEMQKEIKIIEVSNIKTTEEEAGNIFYPILTITKRNMGNKMEEVEIIIKKDSFSKIFTSFSTKPNFVEKNVFGWKAILKPGESFSVRAETNYALPLGIVVVIIAIAALLAINMQAKIVLRKKIVNVKTKGGEPAAKVILFVKAKNDVDNVTIIDRYPVLTELFERYGTIPPDKKEKATRKLEWNFPLKKGEEKVLSYIIFSRIGIIGKIEFPRAFATYKYKGKTRSTLSNSAILLIEEARKSEK